MVHVDLSKEAIQVLNDQKKKKGNKLEGYNDVILRAKWNKK